MKPSKLSLIKVWIFSAALLAGLWSLSSCQKRKAPSFIIIAVDRLAFNAFSCGDDRQNTPSGLNILCKEGIRFTHAYTTSPQPAAAMASLLTGLYPIQHQIHRTFDRLNPEVKTLQEKASSMGYRTYFYGGSPSLLRKTGLSHGFDIFDDTSFIEKKTFALDFKYQSEKLMAAILDDKTSFTSVIYNSELRSLNSGESQISSLEKLDEKFFNFFIELKSRNLWDHNYVIVVGLQGVSDYSRLNETPFSNLNSENTMVSLFLKPPRVKGDEGVSWKVDTPISIADLGHSLWRTITGIENPNSALDNPHFPIHDISAIWLNQNKMFNLPVRRLLVESADTWKKQISVRFSILFRNLIFIENTKNSVFNTLTDGLESIDIAAQQKSFMDDNSDLLAKIRTQKNLGRWQTYISEWTDSVQTNRAYWSKPNSRVELFTEELNRLKTKGTPDPLSALLVRHLVQTKKTSELKTIKLGSMPPRVAIIYEKQKDSFYEFAKLHSFNLAQENLWGIWKPNETWIYSDLILEYQ